MPVRLSDTELELLQGLPHFARSLYVFGIRPHMDYRTGLVGVVRGISWQSLAEALHVDPRQGETDSGTPDKGRVRRAAVRLEKAGLIENRSQGMRLIFLCLAADTDQSARNKPDTNPTQTRHSKADTANSNSGVGFTGEPDTNPTQTRHSKADTPPDSGNPGRNTAVPADNARAPANHVEWLDWFTRKGFRLDQVMKPNVIVGLQEWVRQGVTVADAEMCVAYADSKCSNGKPASPAYYLKFMPEVLRAKENPMQAPTSASGFVKQPPKAAANSGRVRNEDFDSKQYTGTPLDELTWAQ